MAIVAAIALILLAIVALPLALWVRRRRIEAGTATDEAFYDGGASWFDASSARDAADGCGGANAGGSCDGDGGGD